MIRKTFFWLHLAAGLVAGLSIGIMCFTGAVLAFEKEIVAWSERDARRVEVPKHDRVRLSLAELTERVRVAEPDAKPMAITVAADPRAAVVFSLGRDNAVYANPYTGEVRRPASTAVHDFMHVMEDWHRWLALGDEQRAVGKAINGACNLAFFFLAVSGLYLWWPRTWSVRGLKAIVLFNWRLAGKARDFNWHNSLGLWTAPILIVLTLTALPISYRWAANAIYRFAGEEPPAQQGPGAPAGPALEVTRPHPDARPLSHDALLKVAMRAAPRWESLTLRLSTPQRGGPGGQQRPAGSGAPAAVAQLPDAPREGSAREGAAPAREPGAQRGPREAYAGGREGGERRSPQALAIVVREPGAWPRTATTTLSFNPFTGDVLRRETHADLSTARQIRTWTRFLHTGEALGFWGQLVAGLACLGGCVLVYTGFALSWRRFFPRRKSPPPAAPAAAQA